MMSNALSAVSQLLGQGPDGSVRQALQASAPAGRHAIQSDSSLALAAIGICVLAVWLVVRIARPRKLTLRETPGRPNSVDPTIFLLLLVGWYLVGMAGAFAAQRMLGEGAPAARNAPEAGPATAPGPPAQDDPRLEPLAGTIARPIQLALCLGVAAATFRHGVVKGLGLSARRWLNDTVRALVGLLAAWPVCIGLFFLLNHLFPVWAAQKHPLVEAVGNLPLPWKLVTLLSGAVLAPVAEEVLFRGMLQSMLRRATASPWTAVVITSVIFGLIHYSQPTAVLPLIILGAVLGYNYERTGRLLAPILLHAFFNAATLLIRVAA